MKLTKHIKVKVGEYQKDGQTKGKYETIGKVLIDDNGKEMVLLNKIFNPAGIQDGRDSVILNFWDVEEKPQTPHNGAKANAYQPTFDDNSEVPF